MFSEEFQSSMCITLYSHDLIFYHEPSQTYDPCYVHMVCSGKEREKEGEGERERKRGRERTKEKRMDFGSRTFTLNQWTHLEELCGTPDAPKCLTASRALRGPS